MPPAWSPFTPPSWSTSTPPLTVAYDLIRFFQQWAARLVVTLNKGDWVPQLVAAICPDEEYTSWAESENRAVDRARDYKLFKGVWEELGLPAIRWDQIVFFK